MAGNPPERPHGDDFPGAWPTTTANSFRQQYLRSSDGTERQQSPVNDHFGFTSNHETSMHMSRQSSGPTAVPSVASSHAEAGPNENSAYNEKEIESENAMEKEGGQEAGGFMPIKSQTNRSQFRNSTGSTHDVLGRSMSRRKTNGTEFSEQDRDEIERLLTRMFGQDRRANSAEEQNRHVGVVFKNLTVKGQGLGAALQPAVSDIFNGPPRAIAGLFNKSQKADPKASIRTIIDDFTGCVKPGEMLLVLGAPGAGCSSFLKVLANQTAGFESIEGGVTYGGTESKIMAKDYRGEILYNPEDDFHYATLSVKNTLSFALETRTPGKASRIDGETRKQYVEEFLSVVTKLFWIEHTLGTKVGDQFVRGVSGGERKRVSIAEALITKATTQCWDNSTKGLDASTALEYVEALRTLTNMAKISTSVALYQAGEQLYELFDKVVLIHEGKCLYYGPANQAAAHFEGLGFFKPSRWTTADFLTSVTDVHERKVREGWEHRIPRSTEQFAQAYAKSEICQANLRDVQEFERQVEQERLERVAEAAKSKQKNNYILPFHKQIIACTQRQFLIMWGDKQTLVGRWGGIVFLALIIGSLFYNLPKTATGVFPRGGVMFFLLLFNALLALAELTSQFAGRPVLLKHKSFSFYRPAAFAIAQTLVDVPLIFIQVLIFDLVIYFMAGLSRTASQFFISLLFLWTQTMSMYSLFRSVGAWAPSLDAATNLTGVMLQATVVYTGYLIPPVKMRPYFKWLFNLNPMAYAFEGLMGNEFSKLQIQCEPPYLVPQGPGATPAHQSCTIQGSQPGQPFVNGADYIATAFQYTRAHLWRNFGIMLGFWLFFLVVTMLGMEAQKPNAGGAVVTIFKRGQAPKAIQQGGAHDEEKGAAADGNKLETESSESDTEVPVSGVAKNEAIFTYQNINYIIPYGDGERQLLNGVQGYVRPGRLTALMGSSGAGKTTLLNTLAQRQTFGVVTGDFLVDGRPLPKSFQRATGFAEQQDIHEPTATVREALRFSALLRQPKSVPIQEKYDYCETIIDLLEMRSIAGATIGVVGTGLNPEQRKRLTIGVELASKPELLMFLDEPTSGLDSGAAFNIVRFLRKLADAGQAILCTIHQPSSVLFEYFDELLLLKAGGRVVYHGSLGKDSRTMIDYFELNGASTCPPSANPAEYMLEAIGAGNPGYRGKDWGDVWAQSEEHGQRTVEIQQIISERQSVQTRSNMDDDREYAMPMFTQIVTVIKRQFVAYWRTPDYVIGKFMLHIFTGLFNTFTFYHIGESTTDLQSRLFSVFLTLVIAPPLIQQLQPKYLEARQIFESREMKAKIYSWVAFTAGTVVVEIPYSLIAGTVYFNCWWWGAVGRHRNSFESGYTWMFMMLFELFYVSIGQMIAAMAANALLASTLVPGFFTFIVSFCGVLVPYRALPYFWRSWMFDLTPFRYILEGWLGVAVHGIKVKCADNEFAKFSPPSGQTCENYTRSYIAQAGGYVQTGANGLCELCAYATGDEYVSHPLFSSLF